MISSLVIPQTPVPAILDIHRRNLTMSWEAVYYPASRDQTKYGVNITICRAEVVLPSQTQGLLSSSSSLDDDKVPECLVVTKDKRDLIQVNKISGSSEEYIPQIVSTTIRSLQPSVNYKIR